MNSKEERDEAYKRLKKKSEESRRQSLEDAREWPPKDALVKEWTYKGLKCAICHGTAALCGYVHVPENHPDANKWYDDVGVSVHGGLTFRCKALDGGAWFGFDTGHCGDWMGMVLPDGHSFEIPGRIWTVEDMEKETEKLADQFAKMPVKPIPGPGDVRKLDPGEN